VCVFRPGIHKIWYKNKGGDTPVIKGSNLTTGWTLDSGSVFYATVYVAPGRVWVDGTLGTEQTAKGNCVANYDWYYDDVADELYLYSDDSGPKDPDDYNSPGVEVANRGKCLDLNGKDNIVVEGLTLAHANYSGIRGATASSNIIVRNCICEWNVNHGMDFVGSSAYSNVLVDSNICRYNGGHGIYFAGDGSDCTIKRNQCYENGKYEGSTSNQSGIKLFGNGSTISGFVIEMNDCYANGKTTGTAGVEGQGIFEADHIDASTGRPSPNSKTLCGHIDVDPDGLPEFIWTPYYPAGSVQGKVTTTALAGELKPQSGKVEYHPATIKGFFEDYYLISIGSLVLMGATGGT